MYNPEKYSEWKNESSCDCSSQNYYSTKIILEEVSCMPKIEEVFSKIFDTINPWTEENFITAHYYNVKVTYTCKKCSKIFHRTYELTKNGKQVRNGYYNKNLQEINSSNYYQWYSIIEDKFKGMNINYLRNKKNLKFYRWAKDFYNLIINKNNGCLCM